MKSILLVISLSSFAYGASTSKWESADEKYELIQHEVLETNDVSRNGISYFYIEKWTFKIMCEVCYRAKRDKKEAT